MSSLVLTLLDVVVNFVEDFLVFLLFACTDSVTVHTGNENGHKKGADTPRDVPHIGMWPYEVTSSDEERDSQEVVCPLDCRVFRENKVHDLATVFKSVAFYAVCPSIMHSKKAKTR